MSTEVQRNWPLLGSENIKKTLNNREKNPMKYCKI